MRFIVVLGLAVSLASAAALTPIERRQCYTQRDGCCLKQGTCQTCYYGDEPFDCNCECLEYGLCPCTGTYEGKCFMWFSPDGHVSYACFFSSFSLERDKTDRNDAGVLINSHVLTYIV